MKKWAYIICIFIIFGCFFGYFFLNQKKGNAYLPYSHILKTKEKDTIDFPKDDETDDSQDPSQNNDLPDSDSQETILGVTIGKKVQLDLAQSVQETNYYCVPASLQMVLRYHGIEVSQEQLAREMNTSSITGTEYIDLAKTANTYLFGKGIVNDHEPGYHVQTVAINDRNPSIAETFEKRVIQDIGTKDPVFAAVNTNTLYPELPPANHMIVITGYALHKNSDKIAFYYAIDPYTKVQDSTYGGLKIFTAEELVNAIVENEEPAYIW